jgi:carboxylesterase type B
MITKIIKSTIINQIQKPLRCLQSKVKVNVNQGTVKGIIETLPDGRKFQRFSGIPYAKPPIGKLRFRAPQKLMKFDKEEIDCTGEGNQCFQKSLFYQIYVGSEDCLNLNVYVPNDVDIKNLPVMVWIHGGAFSFGSNNREL